MRDTRPLTTALSHPTAASACRRPRNALARSSQGVLQMLLLVALGSLSGTGCLIAEAPSYGRARRTVPVIDDSTVVPQPTSFVEYKKGDPALPFNLNVYSEDAGESVVAAWVIDYSTPDALRLGATTEVPARAADQPKVLNCK